MHGKLKPASMYHIRMKKYTWRVNPIGDGTALEKRRGVKALGGSIPPLSVLYFLKVCNEMNTFVDSVKSLITI